MYISEFYLCASRLFAQVYGAAAIILLFYYYCSINDQYPSLTSGVHFHVTLERRVRSVRIDRSRGRGR